MPRKADQERIDMPPLRPYEEPEMPSVPMDLEPEPTEYAVPADELTREELHDLAQPVDMPPLRDEELPDTSISVIRADPDDLLDDPSWGLAPPAPELTLRKGQQILHVWDEDPEERR